MAKSAPATKLKLNLNLLFPQGNAQKLPIRFLRWLITYGRFLAVVVEVLVIGTFVLRFKLDQDLADIQGKINQKVKYIQSLPADEALIKQTQFKLSTIRNTYSLNTNWSQTLQKISAQEPSGVKLTSLNLTRSTPTTPNIDFKIAGSASTNTDLAILIGGLKQEKFFKNIDLTNVSLDQGIISFTIVGQSI